MPVKPYVNLSINTEPLTLPTVVDASMFNQAIEELSTQNEELRQQIRFIQEQTGCYYPNVSVDGIAEKVKRFGECLRESGYLTNSDMDLADVTTSSNKRQALSKETVDAAINLSYKDFDTDELLHMKSEIEEELGKRKITKL